MKFLCVPCDQPMTLQETRGPENGSLTVIFACGKCGHHIAMLTNAMETQMVRSLGVSIGKSPTTADMPMRTIRQALDDGSDRGEQAELQDTGKDTTNLSAAGESRCPFTGMVEEAMAKQARASSLQWTPEAKARLERIPGFVRAMVQKSIEQYAIEKGYAQIDETVVEEIKLRLGV